LKDAISDRKLFYPLSHSNHILIGLNGLAERQICQHLLLAKPLRHSKPHLRSFVGITLSSYQAKLSLRTLSTRSMLRSEMVLKSGDVRRQAKRRRLFDLFIEIFKGLIKPLPTTY